MIVKQQLSVQNDYNFSQVFCKICTIVILYNRILTSSAIFMLRFTTFQTALVHEKLIKLSKKNIKYSEIQKAYSERTWKSLGAYSIYIR